MRRAPGEALRRRAVRMRRQVGSSGAETALDEPDHEHHNSDDEEDPYPVSDRDPDDETDHQRREDDAAPEDRLFLRRGDDGLRPRALERPRAAVGRADSAAHRSIIRRRSGSLNSELGLPVTSTSSRAGP